MVECMKEVIWMIKNPVLESLPGQMDENIQVNGKTVNRKGKESI